MGRLSDFDAWLKGRLDVVKQTEDRLCELQEKYESFFNEVGAVRESELRQLSGHIAAGRDSLPADLVAQLDAAQVKVEQELAAQLKKLEEERDAAEELAEQVRQASLAEEEQVHRKNVDLDAREEALKARSADLVKRIDDYNARIHELGGGFGFFKNLFAMRRLDAEREVLDEEQASVAAQIDGLRRAWAQREQAFADAEEKRRKQWVDTRATAAAVQAKLDALKESRPVLVFRSVAERVLFERKPQWTAPTAADPKCKRCGSANPRASYFCQICALRLQPDRPDLVGSLEEIAEVNFHHARFSEGMRASQQTIALVRGLKGGIQAFRKSVASMVASENTYPLAKLQISVPQECVAWGAQLERLREAAQPEFSLHPKEFGASMQPMIAALGEDAIKAWFERMGAELSACAKKQWG
jgi:hypothetical protein